jgi:hypothetical protein
MAEAEDKRRELAATCGEEEISGYLHDPSPLVMRSLIANRHLREEDVLIIAKRNNLPPDVLETIARDKRWSESYPIRLALAKNPRSPLRVSLSIARFLRIFDLEEITRSHFIPLVFRHKVEAMIIERVPTMPLGNKKTLAKKAAGNVLLALLRDRDAEVVGLCLNNPSMVEGHLFKILSRAQTTAETVVMIAKHPNWSNRSLIRTALVRNALTPLSLSVPFLRTMKLMDLRELHADPSLPVTVRPFIHRELLKRGKDPGESLKEELFEIDEAELEELDAEVTRYELAEEQSAPRQNDDEDIE